MSNTLLNHATKKRAYENKDLPKTNWKHLKLA